MLIYTKARTIFVVQNLEFQYISDFQKNEYFLGYEDLWIFVLGHHKTWLV